MKIRFICVISGMLLLASAAFGQGYRYDNIALLDTGRPANSATIHVCASGSTGTPCTPPASIFSDSGLSVAIVGGVFTSDTLGNYGFYAACNKYDVQISGSGLTTRTMKDVQIGPCLTGGTGAVTAATITANSQTAPTSNTGNYILNGIGLGFIDGGSGTFGQGGYVVFTNDASNVTGYGTWITNNAFYNGTNWIQPRGVGTSSSGFTASNHKGFSFNRAAASGTNNSIIGWTEVANIDSAGNFVNQGISNSVQGYRVNNIATSGHVLRGTGTNFIDAQLNSSDINTDSANGIVWADKSAGADCGAKINACLASAGIAGECWVRPACGTSWTTAVTVPTSSTLKWYGCQTYTLSAVLTLQQNATAKGPQYGNTLGCVTLKEANGVNLPKLVSLTVGQTDFSNVLVDGNKANNPTGGVGILAVGAQHNIHDVTVQNTISHCFEVSSTNQTTNNSDSAKITNSIGLNCQGDGAYVLNTNDVFLLQDQFENNGNTATVNTTGTAVTATAGSWSTDSSLIGTLVRINGSYFVVSALPSTTTMTLAATAGTNTGVGLQWGNGVECHDCAGMRFTGQGDASNSPEDSVLVYADSSATGVFNNVISNIQMGNLLGNGVKIIGFDVTSNATQFVTNNVITNNTFTSAAGITNNTYAGIFLTDTAQTLVANNRFSTSVGGATHQQVGAVSVTETAGGRDVNEIVAFNQVNGTFQTASADAINCTTTANCNSVYSCGNGVNAGTTRSCGTKAGYALNGTITFANLGTPANGTQVFCSDCNATCTAGAGTGRTCFRENGAWTH